MGSGFEKWQRALTAILQNCKEQEKLLKKTLTEKEEVLKEHGHMKKQLQMTQEMLSEFQEMKTSKLSRKQSTKRRPNNGPSRTNLEKDIEALKEKNAQLEKEQYNLTTATRATSP